MGGEGEWQLRSVHGLQSCRKALSLLAYISMQTNAVAAAAHTLLFSVTEFSGRGKKGRSSSSIHLH